MWFKLCVKPDSQIHIYLYIQQAKTTVLQNSEGLLLWKQVKPQVFFEYFMPDMSIGLMMNTHHIRGTDEFKKPHLITVTRNGSKRE